MEAKASLSLTDVSEIPDDAELAETFYSQFEDEFENDDSEDEIDDEDDLTALIGQMNDALEQTESHDQTMNEGDLPSEGFTDTWRYKRIQALKAECERLLGAEAFRRVYSYLKQARFEDEHRSEDSILDGLAKIVDKPRDCFIVDQLLFMEKQAEIASVNDIG